MPTFSPLRILVVMAVLMCQCESKFAGWVDPDTPVSKKTLVSYTDGIEYDLVMSDEFERSGRTFKDGHDPMWTGIDKADDDQTAQGKKSLQYYNSSHVTTRDGNLVIKTSTEDTSWRGWNPYKKRYETLKRHFKSGMVQGWNKFCFTGGILEVDVQFPGRSDVGGLWPAVWLLGNLGRATYESSTNLMWPWSYDVCNRELQHAQEISKCDITSHFSLNAHQGRGATEIDVIEVMPGPSTGLPIVKNNLRRPYSSMTLQVAPGIPAKNKRPPSGTLPEWGFNWYHNLTYGENTSINPFFYGTYLGVTKKEEPVGRTQKQSYQCDAISSMVQLNSSHFERMHTFRMEWQPGKNGYIHWYMDGKFRFGVEQAGLDPYQTKIPDEPSYVILNTAISTSWGFPNPPPGCNEYDCKTEAGRCGFNAGFCKTLPAEFKIAYVRVYQNKNDGNQTIGCNPRTHPTKRYIAGHPQKYALQHQRLPLQPVKSGGGRCKDDADCGDGKCSAFGRCKCGSDSTGPRCLVPNYHNDFPDWDSEGFTPLVMPTVPSSLLYAAGLCALVLLGAVVCAFKTRSAPAAAGYAPIEGDRRDRASSWL